ncbi:hypothetical protein [Halobaculum gomorrense]|uniref:Uncharacterized protein n=1 Tax=Halobaculum gomorrense TaxID=43928 RepID=A0A1M5MLR6_9EURY|nr:hypothetical protein [Halobaculum gomorrense]SHG78186.1 hypothetical protein SAMN05443636_1057 [Halobaculum gomorrense]
MASWELPGGGISWGDDSDMTDSTTDSTTTSTSLDSVKGVLLTFGRNPLGFILGAVLQPIFAGLDAGVLAILDLLSTVYEGSGPGTEGLLGIADVPVVLADLLIDAGDLIGGGLLTAVRTVVEAVVGPAADGGPVGLILLALAFVVALNLYTGTIRKLVLIAIDAIPGGGGLTR